MEALDCNLAFLHDTSLGSMKVKKPKQLWGQPKQLLGHFTIHVHFIASLPATPCTVTFPSLLCVAYTQGHVEEEGSSRLPMV